MTEAMEGLLVAKVLEKAAMAAAITFLASTATFLALAAAAIIAMVPSGVHLMVFLLLRHLLNQWLISR